MRPIKTKIIAQIISSALEISNNITDATDDLFSYLTDDCRMCESRQSPHELDRHRRAPERRAPERRAGRVQA
ncbi:hypothetical protein [Pararhodobacter sp. SW119]|uniref:hypothetical protein n=1 Tax=Pararhodobacter sp. SW119 TaxID=2780075 RepID=UPI001AE0DD92|nr:hypothetical protein [Pararhodobacter sp. SW119]